MSQDAQSLSRYDPAELGLIRPRHLKAWMEQAFGQRTIIGQQQESGRIVVQPPNRKHTFSNISQKVTDRRSAFRIFQRTDNAGRFVEEKILPAGG